MIDVDSESIVEKINT